MNERRAQLSARKELLLARSRLHRMRIQHEATALRTALTTPRGMLSIASSSPLRPLLLSGLLMVAGRGRAARIVKIAMSVLAAVKFARAASVLLRKPRGGA